MAYNSTYDLLGKKVSDTYPSLLQSGSDGVYYDGRGNSVLLNAANGGVTQITAGGGIIISPSNGVGNVTVNATAATYNTATGSYGSFYDTGSQTAVLATQIYSMSISTTDISNGVYISGSGDPYNTFVKFSNTGTYNVQFSAQFSNSGNNPTDVFIWLRKNDVSSVNDLADSSGVCTVPAKKGSTNGQLIASWNYLINIVAGDFIQLLWYTADANVITLETIAAGTNPTHPRTPALILTAQRVDTFLSNTGSFSGSFTGEFTGSLLGTGSWAVSASQAISSSFARTSITSSYPITATGTTLVSVLPGGGSSGNNNSTFLGASAGSGVTSAYNSNFLGYLAGQSATFAYQSNFIGAGTGMEATRADNSNFFGLFAGQKAVSASFSTLIGYQAGANPNGTATIGTNNIIIGNNITLPANTQNSINLGGIIFATGSYSSLAGNPYSGSQFNIGRVGINKVLPAYTLDVSGSGNYSNGLIVTGSLVAPSITGSLQGTASWANNATTASYALNAVSSSFVLTASYADTLDGINSTQFARVDIDNTFSGINTTTQKTLRSNVEYVVTETTISTNEIVGPDTQSIEVFNIYNLTPYTTDRPTLNTAATFDYTIFDNVLTSIRSGRINLSWTPNNAGQEAITETQTIVNLGESVNIVFNSTVDYSLGAEFVKLNVVNGSTNPIYIRGFLRII